MMHARICALFATSALAAITTPTLAQQAPPAAPAATTQAPDTGAIGEVVVHAQRRDESLQKVPIAVSVVTADQLAKSNFSGLTDLQFIAPSVQYNAYQGGGFEIRGIGTQSFNTSEEQEVAVVIDDVVQGLPETSLAPPFYESLVDIDHIEVLKGPQGTLFGKNSSAGVLQILTNKPKLNILEDDGSVSYGSRNEVKFQDVINIPLSDTFAMRLAGYDFRQDGFIHNLYFNQTVGGYTEEGVRAKFLWKPNEKFEAYLIADYNHATNNGNGIFSLRNCGSGTGAGATAYMPCAIDATYGITPGPNNRNVAVEGLTNAKTTYEGASLHLNYSLGEDTLTSITAYYHLDDVGGIDIDQTPQRYFSVDYRPVHSGEFTQEFRLSSPSTNFLEYTVGAYYYNVRVRDQDTLAGTLNLEPNDSPDLLGTTGPGAAVIHVNTHSYSGFGQATLHINDRLRLIGGIRYTWDTVKSEQDVVAQANTCQIAFAFGAPCIPATYEAFPPYFTADTPFSLPTRAIGAKINASNVSGKIGVEYNFTSAIMGYASIAKGYKGPAIGYNPTEGDETHPIQVRPETSMDYELGVKTKLFDRRVTLNADIFYTKYTNFQAQTYMFDAAEPALSAFVLDNAGGLETKGVEADAVWRPTAELTLSANLAYTPTEFTEYNVPCTTNPAITGAGPLVNPPTPGGYSAACFAPTGSPPGTARTLFNADGYPLANAPRYSYTLGADYRRAVGGGYVADANATWNWRSDEYTVVANPNTIVPAYGLLNLSASIGPQGGQWKLSFFARNVLNQYFVSAIAPGFFNDGSGTANPHPVQGYTNIFNPEALRTIGVKLDFKFGG